MKYVPPSVKETAFNCPHCGALAAQAWLQPLAIFNKKDSPCPTILTEHDARRMQQDVQNSQIPDDEKENLISWAKMMASGEPFLENVSSGKTAYRYLHNLSLSSCFNCEKVAIFVYDRLIYPSVGAAPLANPDMPADVKRDYEEASAILDLSPRGSAALVRLAIQKLCMALGKPGQNINDDIGALVQDGLDTRVQRALDAVRVIGNNAVHPGQIDLRDDRTLALSLFGLLNLVVEKMISEPKHIDEAYGMLPQGALDAIEKRNQKAKADKD